jgi:hypothetical protein
MPGLRNRVTLFWGAWGMTLALGFAGAALLPGQSRVSSERNTRAGDRKTAHELGEIPAAPLKIEKLKGTIKSVDLPDRTVTVAHSGGSITLGFPTAPGREKITLSKKVARTFGKRAFRLEDLQPGSEVRLQYYPALESIMEIIVEEIPK